MSFLVRRPLIGLAPLAVALGGLWIATPVLAADAPVPVQAPAPSLKDDFSAADQYVESVPTARGPKVPGVGRPRHEVNNGENAPPELSPAVKSSLERQPSQTASQLERIATSPDYGAPVEKLPKAPPPIPAAAVSAVDDGGDSTLTWLLVALIATTLLTAGTAAYRRYQSRNTAG